MTAVDPNLFSSLALQYTGGIRAPEVGQAGYSAIVDASGTNIEYVARRTVIGAGMIAQDGDVATTSLSQNVYSALSGTYAAIGTPDASLIPAVSGVGWTYAGAANGRLLLIVSARVIHNSSNATYSMAWYVDGVLSGATAGAYVSSSVAQAQIGCPALLAVTPGAVVDLRITNQTNSTAAKTARLNLVAVALSVA